MAEPTREFNFDGLIGPTHNYAGLSFGNVASTAHRNLPSSPRAAALQGLEKMKSVADLGIGQAVLPPLRRPRFEFLRELGFAGTDQRILDAAYRCQPELLAICYSASSMWTANAATVSPSPDCADGKLNITVANLSSTLHRSIEYSSTLRNLRTIFSDPALFEIHDALPSQPALADEGAANHTRLCRDHGQPGLELFVYGTDSTHSATTGPRSFPARQTRMASQAVARKHGLAENRTLFVQQNPVAIDAGVFHNDVIAVGNQNLLLCHQLAFVDQANCLEDLKKQFEEATANKLLVVEFSENEIGLVDAVSSYLFNSQLLTRPDGNMTMVCPVECQENQAAEQCTQRLLAESNPVDEVHFLDLRQSMNNGGGPACLRLRVCLTSEQARKVHQGVILTDTLYDQLKTWINTHYRVELTPDDLRDPKLVGETLVALEQLAPILDLPVEVLLDH